MTRLEELTPGTSVKGVLIDQIVTVVQARWIGSATLELTYKDSAGRLGSELLYRDREPTLEIAQAGRPWSFDADGGMLRLVSEAYRIRLAHLFDPYLAVHTSDIDPLPHQITAVYGEMIKRQPLRFLLADDPGAGKTIMTGLLIKELIIRGDLKRCLIVCPGNLAEQWQDELGRRFNLYFDILTNDRIEASRTGNPFLEIPFCIARLDKLSRNEDIQIKLEAVDWDLVVCDEAHKMSASFFGGEVRFTKRYRLGQLLSRTTRHFLLLTATPHNGKEEDFQLFMALLDGDRFEGRFRDGVHQVDVSDMMRRMVKEELMKFDGRPLFPERRAYTVNYTLSEPEVKLYKEVTDYVREEFNRADNLDNENRKGTVGFALTILQRRLASSPEAIYQSLKRRRERLEERLRAERLNKRGLEISENVSALASFDSEYMDDLEDAPDSEVEATEEDLVDLATAARTIAELEAEIDHLKRLERMAQQVRNSGLDRKWEELSRLLDDRVHMFDEHGHHRKLVIFTEHRDTLKYLKNRIIAHLGKEETLVVIHGGMSREDRRKAQELFTQDRDVQIMVATDAAGEGINLQRAHLMVNYDLPWNPNRLEQRFGRIHRIGQTEVCHLWNLVAAETREGAVFKRLCDKLEQESQSLNGQVFDVLGKISFDNKPLRDLLIEAIRYGDQPEVRERLNKAVDAAFDSNKLKQLFEENALVRDTMDFRQVMQIREEMERMEARRLQPHFISAFFMEAFKLLGGSIREREPKRYEITRVPADIRSRDRLIGTGEAVLTRYERVCFEKELIHVPGKPMAAFICPGHPLLDATIDLILERYRSLLKQGAVLIDPIDDSSEVRALVYIEHLIQDGRIDSQGERRVVSRQLQFVEIDSQGKARSAGYAPYLDYRVPTDEELDAVNQILEANQLKDDLENLALDYAVMNLVPQHLQEVKQYREELIQKTIVAVRDRLTKEINYWDHRAEDLRAQEQAGKINARINSEKARQRAEELHSRLRKRLEELEQERQLSPRPPVVVGGALIIPQGALRRLKGNKPEDPGLFAQDKSRIEAIAMQTVMEAEQNLGFEPRDVSADKCGYDIESRIPGSGRLRFIEVKGRAKGATTITVTQNEILTALNKPDDFILAVVEVDEESTQVTYIRRPFQMEPDFGVTSVNYDLRELLARGTAPS
ncbi:MAG: DUF3883 domain-containing protein [Syntrophomonadaceae bacterium]|nr:DUF3883 domain-containing protein [Syntrophomonadaceae bacterium]